MWDLVRDTGGARTVVTMPVGAVAVARARLRRAIVAGEAAVALAFVGPRVARALT